ncbi:MAG: hypothetical protein EXS31_15355 [Pedosphaera sp.]|nr:hypothetical protein [Pedosphaera sp.]
MDFNVSIDALLNESGIPLRLGGEAPQLGLDFTASAAVETQLNFGFTFGLNLNVDPGAGDAFFISNATLSGTVSIAATNIDVRASLAGFAVELRDGSIAGTVTASSSFKDPLTGTPGGRITRAQLTAAIVNIGQLITTPVVETSVSFSLPVLADPFRLGGVNIALSGVVSGTDGTIDYSLTAAVEGTLFEGLSIVAFGNVEPSTVTLSKAAGLGIHARAQAFGLRLTLDGTIRAPDNFNIVASAEPFQLGGVTVSLRGSVFQNATERGYELSATVTNWKPVSFLTIQTLTVTLDSAGIGFDTTTKIAGVNGVRLLGTYRFDDGVYRLTANAPVDWTILGGVNLSKVLFVISNQNTDGSKDGTRVTAGADLRMFGVKFNVLGNVTAQGAWIAARPAEAWSPIPGLVLKEPVVITSTYQFTLNVPTFSEVAAAPAQPDANQRIIVTGVNLVASIRLPDNVPAVGGSDAQISGMLGTSLSQMALDAKLVLARPPEIAGLLAFDSVGLRITGEPSISVFGEGRVLHDRIPGLGKDIGVRVALNLDLVHTTLSGSLSLLSRVDNVFGVQGLNILAADGEFGINFATTPLPLPTMGFNLTVETPQFAQDILALPPKLSGAFNVSTTEPIMAFSASNWQPFSKLGLTNLKIQEGGVVYAPSGGSIGLKIFPHGFSANFMANLFGTDVNFEGRFDEETKGAQLEAYVSGFTVAGIGMTGAGPDGVYQDGKLFGGVNDPDHDNGVYFNFQLTPEKQGLEISGRINLPGQGQSGGEAFADLNGTVNSTGVKLDGRIENWNVVPNALRVDQAQFTLNMASANAAGSFVAFSGDLELLHVPTRIEGKISGEGLAFSGSLNSPGTFTGLPVSAFTLSFSTFPNDRHARIEFSLDLPGAGGETTVHGAFENGSLVLDARIADWKPLPGLDFDGTLHARVPLERGSLELDFAISGVVLGSPADFVGSLTASSRGFDIYATGTLTLKLPTGQKLADVIGTIDLGKDSDFFISLGGDFRLPGTESADVRLEGGIGSSGVSLYGRVDDWVLVPGLSFYGLISVRFRLPSGASLHGSRIPDDPKNSGGTIGPIDPGGTKIEPVDPALIDPGGGRTDPVDPGPIKPGPVTAVPIDPNPLLTDLKIPIDALPARVASAVVEIDVSAVLLGSKLRLTGSLVAGERGFDLDLRGHIHFGGPLVGMVSLDLDARVVSNTLRSGEQTFRLDFDGDLKLFSDANTLRVSATLQGNSSGGWKISVSGGVDFHYEKTLEDVIKFSLGVSIGGELSFGSDPDDFSFGLRASGRASASVPKFNLSASVEVSVGIQLDPDTGDLTIKDARPTLEDNNTRIAWKNFTRSPAEKAPTRPSVTAGKGNRLDLPLPDIRSRPTLFIRGSNLSEHVQVERISGGSGLTARDFLRVRLAEAGGQWTTLYEIPTSEIELIDADMGGGNDTIELLAPSGTLRAGIQLPSRLRGGSGSDTLIGGDGPNTIYGNREGDLDAALDGDDVLVGGAGVDLLYGQGGNDILRGTPRIDTLDGGAGVNVINGTLEMRGSPGNDRIFLDGMSAKFSSGIGRVGSLRPGITVQTISANGTVLTASRVPLDEIQNIRVDGGAGDDELTLSPRVLLSSLLIGGSGADRIQAGSGAGTLQGGTGDDILNGGPGHDVIQGDAGEDTLSGGLGDDQLAGGEGRDTIRPGAGSNRIEADAADVIVSEGGTDTTTGGPVAVTRVEANPGAPQRSRVHTIVIVFNRDVGASLSARDFSLVSTANASVSPEALALAWNRDTNTATLTFPGLDEKKLGDGTWNLVLQAASVTDVSGNSMEREFQSQFTVLTGDVNGDARVSGSDLLLLWRELRKPTAQRSLGYDLNGDGLVTLADFEIVKRGLARKP